jgi:hypothetical protein
MKGRADDAGPNYPDFLSSKLVESVLALLEECGAPTEVNDQVVKIIEAWEYSRDEEEIRRLQEAEAFEVGDVFDMRKAR